MTVDKNLKEVKEQAVRLSWEGSIFWWKRYMVMRGAGVLTERCAMLTEISRGRAKSSS